METPTQFDLNEAVRQWRESISSSPALHADNLNELDGHLRDSTAALQKKGLSIEEAFTVATLRLGQQGALQREFGKLNVWPVWRWRVLWMLTGVLLSNLLFSVSNGVAFAAVRLVLPWTWNGHWIGLLFGMVFWTAGIALVTLGWRLASRSSVWNGHLKLWFLGHPIFATVCLVVLLAGPPIWNRLSSSLLLRGIPREAFTQFATTSAWINLGSGCLFHLVVVGLWVHFVRRQIKMAPSRSILSE